MQQDFGCVLECAGAHRGPIIVEEVMFDQQLAPCRVIVCRAGIRVVQSIPLVSTSAALFRVLSTHFPARHRLDTVKWTQ